MTKNIITYGGIALALVLGLFAVTHRNTVVQDVNPVNSVRPVGAVTTLDQIDSPYYSIGGVRRFSFNQPFFATSSQICTIVNPFKASSTLESFSAIITTGIAGTNKFTLSTTTTSNAGNYGSSSPALLLDHSVVANTTDGVVWYPVSATTTLQLPGILSTGESTNILGPNDVVTYRFATTTSAGALSSNLIGACTGTIRKL